MSETVIYQFGAMCVVTKTASEEREGGLSLRKIETRTKAPVKTNNNKITQPPAPSSNYFF